MTEQQISDLKLEIKKMILSTLDIQDIKPQEIDDEAPLFGGGNALVLDSVDALEIIMAIQRKFNVRVADQNQARYTVRSVNSIAEFISNEKAAVS
jgi:acyl carrier protein